MKTYAMTIGGEAVAGERTLEVLDPSTEKPFAQVYDATRAQLDHAVASAHAAFADWSTRPHADRQAALVAMGGALEANAEEIATLIMQEQGKPLAKGHSELRSTILWMAADAKMDLPVEVLRENDKWRVELHRRPLGVVGAITAWNYPVLLAFWKIAPALLTGNTVVVKPSPYTPVATLRAAEIVQSVLPPGVLNAVSGGDDLGRWITEHPTVRKITFTGSVETGKKIMASASGNLKRLTLELGGNDAGILLDDVDPKAIAKDLFWARFSNCGQVCAALKRMYVPASLYDQVVSELVDVAKTVHVGPGTADGVEVGPVQNAMQLGEVKAAVEEAVSKGASIAFQGEVPSGPGYYHPITILRDVPDDAGIVRKEAFGPVLAVLKYDDVEDAIRRANDSIYGLGASVWGADTARANAIAARLEAGSAWVNDHPAMGPDIPFGGVKQSGIGVEGSSYGLQEFTDTRVVWNRV